MTARLRGVGPRGRRAEEEGNAQQSACAVGPPSIAQERRLW